MRVSDIVSRTLHGLRSTALSLAMIQMSVGPALAATTFPRSLSRTATIELLDCDSIWIVRERTNESFLEVKCVVLKQVGL